MKKSNGRSRHGIEKDLENKMYFSKKCNFISLSSSFSNTGKKGRERKQCSYTIPFSPITSELDHGYDHHFIHTETRTNKS